MNRITHGHEALDTKLNEVIVRDVWHGGVGRRTQKA